MSASLTLNNSFNVAIFTDAPGTAIRPSLIYSGSSYLTSSMPVSASTPATQRLGIKVIKELPLSRSHEKTDIVGGVRLGNVTIFQNGEPSDQINIEFVLDS